MNNQEKNNVKIAKKVAKEFADMIVSENDKFENEYVNLYDKLKGKFEFSFKNLQDSERKIEFLEKQMRRISEANFNMKNNYKVSDIAEQQEEDLNDLFEFFEYELNKLYDFKAKNLKLVNAHPNIFASDFAYTLFYKMHEQYKLEGNNLANYSFLYYSMKKDDFINCKGVEFVNVLGEYDIVIDKIDSRQSGSNSKKSIYELNKSRLEAILKTNQ
ncbi:hypothetical protein [Maribacter aestuarii]|uniref:hypothetical protein n=1 Tax=Maribacter aestuarii TaxID=1130723 RepID=UPI00248C4012|nr:hypothetical protein [Maribacter aestuarii]